MTALIDTVHIYTRLDGAEQTNSRCLRRHHLVEADKVNISHLVRERQSVIASSPLPRISVYREQAIQVFQSLLSYAIQNCSTTPRVDISADEASDHWLFRVSDNVPGIGQEDIEKLFQAVQATIHHDMQARDLPWPSAKKFWSCMAERFGETKLGKGAILFSAYPKVESPGAIPTSATSPHHGETSPIL